MMTSPTLARMNHKGFHYCEGPQRLTGQQWLLVLGSVLLATACLLMADFTSAFVTPKLNILVFAFVPVGTFIWLSGDRAAGLFSKISFRGVCQMVGFGLLTFLVAILSSVLLSHFFQTVPNHAVQSLADLSGSGYFQFFVFSIPQLFGEEVVTVLPFLAVIWLCVQRFEMSWRWALILAWLTTSVWFALIHLPTYDWHWGQVLGGVGVVRLVLTAAFIITRNLWVSFGAHLVNDWIMFGLAVLLPVSNP